MSEEFIEGSRGVYRPIRVLFGTPVYERALQICWHMSSYKVAVAAVIQLLELQRAGEIPAEVTVDDMTELLLEKSKESLRVQLWEFELEDFQDEEARSLLTLVWEVNNSFKMRDVQFEAKKLLESPEDVPPRFRHPKMRKLAEEYGGILTELLKAPPASKQLSAREVVMEVVPQALQALWVPPRCTYLSMPSQWLSTVAVGVTKAVLDRVSNALSADHRFAFCRSLRDVMVHSIEEKVRHKYSEDPQVLRKKLNGFNGQELSRIADIAAREICQLFL